LKERFFEIVLLIFAGIGLIVFFTLLYGGPSFVVRKLIAFFTGVIQ